MSDQQALFDWATDGDMSYLGARACWIEGLMNPAHQLAHAAIERYLKGILQFHNSAAFNPRSYKREYLHDLPKLFSQASKEHVELDRLGLQDALKLLDVEVRGVRYLIDADRPLLTSESHSAELLKFERQGQMDLTVCAVREQATSLLDEGLEGRLPLTEWRRAGRSIVSRYNAALP